MIRELASEMNVQLDKRDISIANRLLSKSANRPVIVKFTRRVSKINMLRCKRNLRSSSKYGNVRIYEDVNRARLNFFNLIKTDPRIKNAWSREGVIFYIWRFDGITYKFNDLYEAGVSLDYNVRLMLDCFNHSMSSSKTNYDHTISEANQMEIRTDSHQNEQNFFSSLMIM